MSEITRSLCDSIDMHRNGIVAFSQALIRFNTTFPEAGQKPIAEKEFQQFIARHLASLGAKVDAWEPDLKNLTRYPNYIPNRPYKERPIVC